MPFHSFEHSEKCHELKLRFYKSFSLSATTRNLIIPLKVRFFQSPLWLVSLEYYPSRAKRAGLLDTSQRSTLLKTYVPRSVGPRVGVAKCSLNKVK